MTSYEKHLKQMGITCQLRASKRRKRMLNREQLIPQEYIQFRKKVYLGMLVIFFILAITYQG